MGVGDVMVDGRTKDIGPDSTGGQHSHINRPIRRVGGW